jgi:hypothetical protein
MTRLLFYFLLAVAAGLRPPQTLSASAPQLPAMPKHRVSQRVQSPRASTSLTVASVVSAAQVPTPNSQIRIALGLPRVHTLNFSYPPGLDPAKYTWFIESSPDLRTWIAMPATNDYTTVFTTNRAMFYRVKGVLK